MSIHKRKRCWFCAQKGLRRTFRNRNQLRDHIYSHHDPASITAHLGGKPVRAGKPNVVHYGARMRRKLGLKYNKDGHLVSTLEAI